MRRVELSQAVESVREQLSALNRDVAGKDLVFDVGPVELEFTVEVSFAGETGTAVKLWVVEAGAKGSVSDSFTQTVRVTLEPRVRSTGRRPEVADPQGDLLPRPAQP
ncbi:trypco2 family protein [Streptomyces sp. NPDC006458]|uniref:trypco2 family protein n=1 Tax=Streptomyces sp. NPDC006458 TaxID=3154302 RepID=UPI0033B780A9